MPQENDLGRGGQAKRPPCRATGPEADGQIFCPQETTTITASAEPKSKTAVPVKPVVMVVDDDPRLLRFMKILLENNGFEVKTAATGQQALQMLRDLVPAALALDVELPNMSGYDLCHIIKRNERLEGLPVIFVTAHGAPADYQTGHEAGAVAYMVKPYDPHRLVELIRMLTRQAPASS